MRVSRCAVVATLGTVLLVSGCKQDTVEEKHHPAKVEESGQEGIMKVTLEARAAKRIGLQTTPVLALAGASGGTRLAVPYSAIMYDTKGQTWTFTNPQPLVYVRHKIVVESVDGDRVILAEGPPPGTAVVTVGAAELMGAEHKYGH